MYYASLFGYIDVLEWWKQSGLDLIYDTGPMDQASLNARINVLNWWV